MDLEEIADAAQRGHAIEEWLANIADETMNSGVSCAYYEKMIFFDSDRAKELFVQALNEELKEIERYISRLSR